MVQQLSGHLRIDRVLQERVGEVGNLGPELGFAVIEAGLCLQELPEHCSLREVVGFLGRLLVDGLGSVKRDSRRVLRRLELVIRVVSFLV